MGTIDNIRNFAIIAHIDHGKSTIADRIIHICGGLPEREMTANYPRLLFVLKRKKHRVEF